MFFNCKKCFTCYFLFPFTNHFLVLINETVFVCKSAKLAHFPLMIRNYDIVSPFHIINFKYYFHKAKRGFYWKRQKEISAHNLTKNQWDDRRRRKNFRSTIDFRQYSIDLALSFSSNGERRSQNPIDRSIGPLLIFLHIA